MEFKVILVLQVQEVSRELMEQMALMVSMEFKVILELLVPRVQEDSQELTEWMA